MKVTIKDVARESGVSIATVSRVINNNGYVSDEIKEKVENTIVSLNYQVNGLAKSLKEEKTNMIGIIIPDISNPYFMQIAKGLEDELESERYNLIFSSSNEDPVKETKLINLLLEKRVEVIIIATTGGNEELIKNVEKNGTKVILIDRYLDRDSGSFHLILENNFLGGYKLTQSIINQGHKKIGVVNGSFDVNTGSDRYKGFEKAIEDYKIQRSNELIYNGEFRESCGFKAVNKFIKSGEIPSGIIAFNNLMAIGVIKRLYELGYNVPDDVCVASYGELDTMGLLNNLKINFIKQKPYEMGIETGKVLKRMVDENLIEPHISVYEPELCIER
ncbi:LacI family DNA-binding transcriptional regulator [Aquisalibacillus elongatus]|uniref:LacI family transcriptional regulator n=1 Tax=Aquisalibacillus elongatus TaxID=485577 RepID=A0A3N5B942_9BACI|nr:LacI family DNA-binding transcriptional regulator [Aquisalibacillus elongatus]RPF54246.1 LacI family transcriptional regulator [Aquisalibacillus elongatus]